MNWIVDWWKLLALVLFIAVMIGLTYFAKWSYGSIGWWAPIVGGLVFFLIAWLIDRRSKPGKDLE